MKYRWHLDVNKAEGTKLRRAINSCSNKRILKPHRADSNAGDSGCEWCELNYAGACTPTVKSDLDCTDITARSPYVVGDLGQLAGLGSRNRALG